MRETDKAVALLPNNSQQIQEFIAKHDFYILKTVSKTANRYISKDDDEYSIALFAFYDAINKYDFNKGSFYAFADLIIKRSIIDFYRTQKKYAQEIKSDKIETNQVHIKNDYELRLEIEAIKSTLQLYGFTFFDLAKNSPKAEKTKKSCKAAINFVLDNPQLINEMRDKKQLPLKIIQNNIKVPRKILERHRKYIIAAVEIFHGGYMGIAQYLSYLREGRIK